MATNQIEEAILAAIIATPWVIAGCLVCYLLLLAVFDGDEGGGQ